MTKRSVALIRTKDVDQNVKRLEEELTPFFKQEIFYMVDCYHEIDMPALRYEGKSILVGRRFLESHGLPWFPKVGWQCGDFMYYAALEAIPQYDFYWLIENDVSVRSDAKNLFEKFNECTIDFILPSFGPRPDSWEWYESARMLNDGNVYGGLFPISRISKKAAKHLLKARVEYSSMPYIKEETWKNERNILYANDESFCSTVLMRDGFSCEALESFVGASMMKNFTLDPIHPKELAFINEGIVHAVCEGDAAKYKFLWMLEHNFKDKIKKRMEEFCSRLSLEEWRKFSGINDDLIS